MYRILIVEDDETIARLAAEALEGWGYEVVLATDFTAVYRLFEETAPHLVLLDLSLPHRSGFYWCGEIRRTSSVPIVFISSAASNMNMVTALHQGADDFIAKPFDITVLVAKVQALLRRSYRFAEGEPPTLRCGETVLNLGGMVLEHGNSKTDLTRNEVRILQILFENRGRVVSRDAMMRRLWDDESFIDENTLSVNIGRLRKKLEAAGLPGLIATKKGEGYLLT